MTADDEIYLREVGLTAHLTGKRLWRHQQSYLVVWSLRDRKKPCRRVEYLLVDRVIEQARGTA